MAAAGLGTRSPGEDAGTEDEVLEAVQVASWTSAATSTRSTTTARPPCTAPPTRTSRKVVEFLADKGARIEVWNRKNKYGWTPLTIADGYRFGNFKPSPVTITAIRQVMAAAGVSPPAIREPVKSREIY